MGAKAVVVIGPSGQAIVGAEITLITPYVGSDVFPLTNADGYALSNHAYGGTAGYIKVVANGFSSYIQTLSLDDDNQEIHINAPGGPPNTIHLPGLTQGFKKPSRDQIINVMANLCNLRDSDDIPIFEPFLSTLIYQGSPKATDWINTIKLSGATHVNLAISYNYLEDLGWTRVYPIQGMDFTQRLNDFANILKYVQSRGLIPIVKLAFDGIQPDPIGWTYGWQWGIDNVQRIANELEEFKDSVLWSTGFDGCFAVWTPEQLVSMLMAMRQAFGQNACIDTETNGPGTVSYSHLGQGAANWVMTQLGMCDTFSVELEVNPTPPSPDLLEGIKETAERLCDPNSPVYYRNQVTKKQGMVFYETVAYWAIRKQSTPEDARNIADIAKARGFTCFGNGLPH